MADNGALDDQKHNSSDAENKDDQHFSHWLGKDETAKRVFKLVKKRGGYRAKTTLAIAQISRLNTDEITNEELSAHIETLVGHKKMLQKLDEEIADTYSESDNYDEDKYMKLAEQDDDYQRRLNIVKSTLENKMSKISIAENKQFAKINAAIKIPKLELQKFDGDAAYFSNFKKSFQNVYHNLEMTNADRLRYLKQSLEGDPKKQIEALEETDSAYEEAWRQLEGTYATPGQIKFALIKKFLDLSPVRKTAREMRGFQSQMLSILNLIKTNEVKLEDVLLYSFYKKLDKETQEILRTYDFKLYEPLEKFTAAVAELIKGLPSEEREEPSPIILTSQVKSQKTKFMNYPTTYRREVNCKLCLKSGHKMEACRIYQEPEAKIQRIKELNLCLRCAKGTHFAKECFAKLAPCTKCHSTRHLSILCTAPKDTPQVKKLSYRNKEKQKI